MKYETFEEILKKLDKDIEYYHNGIKNINSRYVDENNNVKSSIYNSYKREIRDFQNSSKINIEEDLELLRTNSEKIRSKQAELIKLSSKHINENGRIPRRIVIGKNEISINDESDKQYIPRLVDFPFEKSMYISGENQYKLLHKIILRLLYALPLEKFQITVFDSNGYGKVIQEFNSLFTNEHIFPCKKILSNKRELQEHLEEVEKYIENLRSNIFNNSEKNWKEYNRFMYSKNEKGKILPYKLFLFMDVPQNLDEETFNKFKNLIKNGKECGIVVIFSFDKNILEAKDTYNNKITIDLRECINNSLPLHKVIDDDVKYEYKNINVKIIGEKIPEIDLLQKKINDYLKILDVKKSKYNIEDFLDMNNRFNKKGDKPLSLPIGYSDFDNSILELIFEGPVAHCLVGGTTGSGKTTFLNELILSSTNRYSPRDLQLVLLDFKEAVEFTAYTKPNVLPHVKLVATDADEYYGLDVLKQINKLITDRGKLFKENSCKDIYDYNKLDKENIPRILLIIDEFQVLLQSKYQTEIKNNLINIAKKGRSFGIHMILSTQSIKGLDLTGIFEQIKAKIILNCSAEDSINFFGGNQNDEANKINRPYAILNAGSGEKEDNIKFRVPWRDGIVEKVVEDLYSYCKRLNLRAENKIFDGTQFPEFPDDSKYNKNGNIILRLGQISNYNMDEFKIEFSGEKKQNLTILINEKKQKNMIMESIIKSIIHNEDYDLFYLYEKRINEIIEKSNSINKTNDIIKLSEMMNNSYKKKVLILDDVNILNLKESDNNTKTNNDDFSDLCINEEFDYDLYDNDNISKKKSKENVNSIKLVDIKDFIMKVDLKNDVVIAFYSNATDFYDSLGQYETKLVQEFSNVISYELNEKEMSKICDDTKTREVTYYYIFNRRINYSFRPYKIKDDEKDKINYEQEVFEYNS